MADIKLLDCTLRDGGYVNSWNWGFAAAKDIIASLTRAGTDIVEVGFLRNVDGYNPDVTVCNTIEELNRLLPAHTGSTMYSGMAMRSNYDIAKLSPYEGHGIEMLRITAHDYDIREGMDFARDQHYGLCRQRLAVDFRPGKRDSPVPVLHCGYLRQHAAA